MKPVYRAFVLACALACPLAAWAAGDAVTDLRVEHFRQPLGLGVKAPRFSWAFAATRRGARQAAYRVLVASSPALLARDRGDLWDTGRVTSDQSQFVVYAGKPLVSRQRVWWRVFVVDERGTAVASAPDWFELGLLAPTDWSAKWIGASPGAAGGTWDQAQWIWYPENDPPAAHRYFRTVVQVPADAGRGKCPLRLTVDDQFVLYLNGDEVARSSGQTDAWHSPVTVDLAARLKPGPNLLALDATNSGNAAGAIVSGEWDLGAAGKAVVASSKAWRCAREAAAGWNTAAFDDAAWQPARELGPNGTAPWGQLGTAGGLPPSPHLRRAFSLDKPISRARLYISALGLYEARLNGRKVGDVVFSPEWTDYHKRVQYRTEDVTALLKPGANVLGAMLGDGWWCGHVGLGGRARYGQRSYLLAQLMVDHPDGSTTTIASGDGWKAGTGPLLFSDLLMGESYDAGKAIPGWDANGFKDDAWAPADTVQPTGVGALEAPSGPPVRVLEELAPKTLKEPAAGKWTFDLGQNMVGFVRLKLRAAAGTKVTLRFAEMLNPDGTVYTTNLRGARCTDEYTCSGRGEEVWQPTFTFRGFRYVELTGVAVKPALDALTGVVVGSDIPRTGAFECSEPRLNQLYHNIYWGQRGNFLSVPTDCPQRDERLGWMGDAQIFVRTASFNNDVSGFFTKWLVDVDDAQRPDGAFTDVSPFVAGGAGTAAWGDAGVICPHMAWLAYGDQRMLADHYPAMTRWVDYCRTHSKGLLRPAAGYGDWLSIGANTPTDVLATAYFAYSTSLTAQAARTLGRNDDADKHQALFEDIKRAYIAAYVSPDGHVKGNTQTCYLLSLRFGLLPAELRAKATGYLVDDITRRGDRLSTGFVGVGHLLPTLTAEGRSDVAWKLLLQDAFPSWLFSVKHGATTIWERWDGWTPEKGFQDPGMNSFNHYSFGSCGEWMQEKILGIAPDPAQPGYRHITVAPLPGGGVTWAKGHYDSGYGRIATSWRMEGGRFSLELTVPAGVTATVTLPGSKDATESGKPWSPGATGEVGAGVWKFACALR